MEHASFPVRAKDEDHPHRLSPLHHQAPPVGKSKNDIILYVCLCIKKLCDLFGWIFLQGAALWWSKSNFVGEKSTRVGGKASSGSTQSTFGGLNQLLEVLQLVLLTLF